MSETEIDIMSAGRFEKMICEGFQLVVIVKADFGKTIQQAMIKVEPWKLLEALRKVRERTLFEAR